ncbi:MAG TPA: putative LPS assembly protein LptD, partial [Fibrobacteraceae bacterium]|nr:putative LPS assembly protein LptD [Fibrobacteraceae bacterium]
MILAPFGWALAAEALTAIHDPEAAADTIHMADTTSEDTLDPLSQERVGPDTVEYSAVALQYDFPTKTFNLNDKALIRYRGATLSSDTIWFNQGNNELQASGDPVLQDPKNPPLAGYRMKYNLDSRIGQVFYGSGERDDQHFNGMDIRRLPDSRLQIARGDFCACQDSNPSYYFYSRRMVVQPKEQVVAAPVVLNIEDVPVAVLPLMVSPLKSGRRSGFLTPKFGGDQEQGFYLNDIGYYWAINDYMDATTSADVVEGSEAKFEKSSLDGQFRYKKLYVLDGNVSGTAYLKEFNLANSGWDVSFSHNQNLRPDGKSKLAGSGSFVSSQHVRTDNALDEETILNQQANAQLTWSRTFSNGRSLTVKTKQDDNLVTGLVTREIPDVQFRSSGELFPFIETSSSGEEDFWEKFTYSFYNRFNYYTLRNHDTVNDVDTSHHWLGNSFTTDIGWTGQFLDVINITPKYHYRG